MVRSARRLFPERQILVRAEGRVSYITLGRRTQIAIAAGLFALVVLIAYGVTGALHHGAAGAAGAPPEVQARLDHLQHQLDAANEQLAQGGAGTGGGTVAQGQAAVDDVQVRIKALEDARDRALTDETALKQQLQQAQQAATNRSQNLAQLNTTLDANRGELKQSDAQRQALQSRVRQLEGELESANSRTNQAKADLASNERRLQQLAAEHDKTLAERDRLQTRLLELQHGAALAPITPNAAEAPAAPAAPQRSIADRPADQHSESAPPAAAGTVAAAPPTDEDTAPANQHSENAPAAMRAAGSSGELERVLASTGLDVEKMLNTIDSVPEGEGGPFIPLTKKDLSAANSARTAQLRKILKTLPLAAPLDHYELGSGFGARLDPINHRQAFHPGLDLVAPYRSPVYSTAPGVVIFTGVKDSYGKVVEIDHGHGIVTRYAHLHRFLVARGQRVGAHHLIGELGSTGRSTGPHLHYEVLVDGVALDPEKFLQAGKNVVQANGQ
ncbi:MAG TPA: peptidoglycan DD-metalloendopeptidase family protein [Stellaceae bacterium]|nr:peptidoglycan DD-metalloendopeptidase family protein [Stellaceae bacterium]